MIRAIKATVGVIVIALLVSACVVLREPEAASGPIEAVPLAENSAGEAANPLVYEIVPSESTVRFEIGEHLRSARTGWALGANITVVGTTDQVAGELALDPADLATAQIGDIRINARTFKTDEFYRTRAIQNQILLTDQYEFITFAPTGINGLPESAEAGDQLTFTIAGDLTIRDVTLQETFVVTASLTSPAQIEGTASTVIPLERYGLTIPDVPNVAEVDEDVVLYLDFVARAP